MTPACSTATSSCRVRRRTDRPARAPSGGPRRRPRSQIGLENLARGPPAYRDPQRLVVGDGGRRRRATSPPARVTAADDDLSSRSRSTPAAPRELDGPARRQRPLKAVPAARRQVPRHRRAAGAAQPRSRDQTARMRRSLEAACVAGETFTLARARRAAAAPGAGPACCATLRPRLRRRRAGFPRRRHRRWCGAGGDARAPDWPGAADRPPGRPAGRGRVARAGSTTLQRRGRASRSSRSSASSTCRPRPRGPTGASQRYAGHQVNPHRRRRSSRRAAGSRTSRSASRRPSTPSGSTAWAECWRAAARRRKPRTRPSRTSTSPRAGMGCRCR